MICNSNCYCLKFSISEFLFEIFLHYLKVMTQRVYKITLDPVCLNSVREKKQNSAYMLIGNDNSSKESILQILWSLRIFPHSRNLNNFNEQNEWLNTAKVGSTSLKLYSNIKLQNVVYNNWLHDCSKNTDFWIYYNNRMTVSIK